jgi:hypothetical protein
MSSLSATMKATGSPTWRTRPSASAVRGGTISGVTAAMQGIGPRSRDRPQHKRHEPRRARRMRNVDPLDEGMGMRRAQDMAPQTIGTLDIRQVTAMPGEEALILDAAD